jgi:hypothetical protein
MEVTARYPKEFAARSDAQQYQLPRSVHQYDDQSHKLSGSLLSSLQALTPIAKLQQVTPIVKAGIRHTVCQRCTHVLITRHAPRHAALPQHQDVDADSPRATQERPSEMASSSAQVSSSMLASLRGCSNGCFQNFDFPLWHYSSIQGLV